MISQSKSGNNEMTIPKWRKGHIGLGVIWMSLGSPINLNSSITIMCYIKKCLNKIHSNHDCRTKLHSKNWWISRCDKRKFMHGIINTTRIWQTIKFSLFSVNLRWVGPNGCTHGIAHEIYCYIAYFTLYGSCASCWFWIWVWISLFFHG